MKTLQIWFGPEDSSKVKPYMESVIKFTPDATHYFIGSQQNSIPGQTVLVPNAELDYGYAKLNNNPWWTAYNTQNMFKADMIRLAWALDNQDLLYVDADVEFIASPTINYPPGTPIMGIYQGLQEFFLFYVNNNSNWFQDLIDYTTAKSVVPFAFMKTFVNIRRGTCLSRPLMWNENTFYKRHNIV